MTKSTYIPNVHWYSKQQAVLNLHVAFANGLAIWCWNSSFDMKPRIYWTFEYKHVETLIQPKLRAFWMLAFRTCGVQLKIERVYKHSSTTQSSTACKGWQLNNNNADFVYIINSWSLNSYMIWQIYTLTTLYPSGVYFDDARSSRHTHLQVGMELEFYSEVRATVLGIYSWKCFALIGVLEGLLICLPLSSLMAHWKKCSIDILLGN